MSTAPSFPGETVISSFTQLEGMFQEVLGHIPYVPEHEDVWSPSLVTILLEACSQLDSLWKFIASNTPGVVPPSRQECDHHPLLPKLRTRTGTPMGCIVGARRETIGTVLIMAESHLCSNEVVDGV